MEKGMELGRLKIACSMLARGMSMQEVSEITDLPLDRLRDLAPHL